MFVIPPRGGGAQILGPPGSGEVRHGPTPGVSLLNYMKKTIQGILMSVFATFVISNIFISQAVSPFFPAITRFKDVDQTALFLKNIRASQEFPSQLTYFESLYGPDFHDKVFSEEKQRVATIQNLEAVLVKNPKSTDILVNLSQLHRANAEEEIADKYLNEAKAIDPWINSR